MASYRKDFKFSRLLCAAAACCGLLGLCGGSFGSDRLVIDVGGPTPSEIEVGSPTAIYFNASVIDAVTHEEISLTGCTFAWTQISVTLTDGDGDVNPATDAVLTLTGVTSQNCTVGATFGSPGIYTITMQCTVSGPSIAYTIERTILFSTNRHLCITNQRTTLLAV